MLYTIVMFFVLSALYVVMVGLVRFSENVITKPQLVASGDGTETKHKDGVKSV